jgi:hypothetical protein
MKILWPPTIPPAPDYPRWFTGWLQEQFSASEVIERHCRAGDIPLETYVPREEDAYLLRCSLAELLLERGHGAVMVGDRIEITLDMADRTVRAACGLK